jgi:hypothetical protein
MILIDSDVLLAYTRGHLSLLYYWRFRLVIIHGRNCVASLPAPLSASLPAPTACVNLSTAGAQQQIQRYDLLLVYLRHLYVN